MEASRSLRHIAFRSVGLVCLFLSVTPACGDDGVPWAQTWTSTHFQYLTRAADTEACPDLLPLLEAHAQTIHDSLGLAWPTDRKVTYHRFIDQADFIANGPCPSAGGCAVLTTVESADAFQRHELIHAYLFPVGTPPPLILEGAAVALSCELDTYSRPTSTWREAFDSDPYAFGSDPDPYRGGGWLVGHLLRRYGPEPFLRLYATVPYGASASEFESMFNQIYPDPLETIWGQMIAAANRPVFCPWECGQPALPLDGTVTMPVPVCGETQLQRTIELTSPDAVLVQGGNGIQLGFLSCAGADTPMKPFVGMGALQPGYFEVAAMLGSGTIVLSFESSTLPSSLGTASATLGAASPALAAPACGSVRSVSFTAPFYEGHFALFSTPAAPDEVTGPASAPTSLDLRLELPQPSTWSMNGAPVEASTDLDALACPSCDSDPASCQALSAGSITSFAASNAITIRTAPIHPFALTLSGTP